MVSPRTTDTIMLEQFKGQFFQWFYIDGFALPKVKELFDELFANLAQTTGEQIQATYKQWRGRHRYWNKTWRMPKKAKGSAPAVFPPQLEGYQLWCLGTDEVLAVGSTVASVCTSNSLSLSLSHDTNHHEQQQSAGHCQTIGTHGIESYYAPVLEFTTAPDFDKSFQERGAIYWAMLSPSPEISRSSDPFDQLNEDASSSLLTQGDLSFHPAHFLPPPITDPDATYSKMGFPNTPDWTSQHRTSLAPVPGLTFQETEETRRPRSNSQKSAPNPFAHLPPSFESPSSEGTMDDTAFYRYPSGS